jgi:hypothetical protein
LRGSSGGHSITHGQTTGAGLAVVEPFFTILIFSIAGELLKNLSLTISVAPNSLPQRIKRDVDQPRAKVALLLLVRGLFPIFHVSSSF